MSKQFEHLANEILITIFDYVSVQDLYRSFWGLNQRLNDLLQSLNKLSVKIENNDLSLIETLADRIIRLEVDIPDGVNWSLFPNLRSLTLKRITFPQSNELALAHLP
ncbi:unnamed protein product, partial [Adineta ricciae]